MTTEALSQIKNLLGQGGFIDEADAMQPYVTSMRNRYARTSPLVALPNSTEQVAAIVKLCRQYRLPIVPQGGNTGLVDGGIPSPDGKEIILSLSRMNKIRDIDTVGSIATVEAGVILQTLEEAAAAKGFLFPLWMASQGSAQIGGAISTNAGGTAVLRYGNMRNLVLGLEAVLPDGSVISSLKKLAKDNTGYNLASTFIGAEGTLGIITAATVKLYPALQQKLTAVVAVQNAALAMELFGDFRRECAEYLLAFEIMSHNAIGLAVKHIPNARFPGRDDAPYYVLIEFGASSPDAPLRALFEKCASAALDKGKIIDAVIAENTTQAAQFRHVREHIPDALRKQGGGIHFDISVPLDQIADFLPQMEQKIHALAPDMTLMPFGHIGDGNLHYNMYTPPGMAKDAFVALKKRIQDLVFGEVDRRQGSISAEHGIGIERKDVLAAIKSSAELNMMRAIKRALDPDNIMNPGKVFD